MQQTKTFKLVLAQDGRLDSNADFINFIRALTPGCRVFVSSCQKAAEPVVAGELIITVNCEPKDKKDDKPGCELPEQFDRFKKKKKK